MKITVEIVQPLPVTQPTKLFHELLAGEGVYYSNGVYYFKLAEGQAIYVNPESRFPCGIANWNGVKDIPVFGVLRITEISLKVERG